jgi:hypothetical protein
MISSRIAQKPSNGKNQWADHPDREIERVGAELLDGHGQVVSIGEAELVFEKGLAYFYPRDVTPLRTIRSRAKSLFLSDSDESLGILDMHDCPEGRLAETMHFHLQLR